MAGNASKTHHTSRPMTGVGLATSSKSRPVNSSPGRSRHTGHHDPPQKHGLEKGLLQTDPPHVRNKAKPRSAEVLITRPTNKATSSTRTLSKTRHGDKHDSHTFSHGSDVEGRTNSVHALDCWKFFMILANIVMIFGGIAAFVLGGWMIFDNTFTGKLFGTNLYLITVYVLLGSGFFAVVLGVIGCIGAARASKFLILMYMILALSVLMLMLGGTFAMFMCRAWVRRITQDHMSGLLDSYTTNSVIRDAWDTTQQNLECCGVISVDDWPADNIPGSCCPDGRCEDKESAYKAGCLNETEKFFDHHVFNIAAAVVGVNFIILFGLISTCGYHKALKKHRTIGSNKY